MGCGNRGLWTLCDGGYHKWLTTICGSKHADMADLKGCSGLCESVRKDVECVLGMLKKRFAILAGRTLNYHGKDIDRTVCEGLRHSAQHDLALK